MNAKQLGELIDRHAGALILYARQWCAAPEDVVQESFLKLLKQTPLPDDVPAWLYRVVRNGALDALKSNRRREKREARVARPERWFVEDSVSGLDAEQAVRLLQELPLEQREVIVAHLWGGLSFEQIGKLSDCSTSTAFRRYSSGIELLRSRMGVECRTN
jgi:RNA polymerase sigma-70 factor (ECF subfamily)